MELYGGAILLNVPEYFEDVSVFRQVPDHQMVYSHTRSDQSFIVEILNYEDVSDDVACNHFFQDLAESNTASRAEIVRRLGPVHCKGVTDTVMICEGEQTVAKFNETGENRVRTYLAVLRLPQKRTDILVTLNCPETVHPESTDTAAPPTENEFDAFVATVLTMRIVDWDLFKS